MGSTGRWVQVSTKGSALIAIRETSTEVFPWNWPVVGISVFLKSVFEVSSQFSTTWQLKKNKQLLQFLRFFFFFFPLVEKRIPVQCATQQPDSSCLCRRDILEKVLEQFLHWYFFTSEWVCRWALRLDLSANALLQWGQEKGFSPGKMTNKTLSVTVYTNMSQ